MKALNPSTGNLEEIYVKALDSLPVGIILEFPTTDSSKVPYGYMFCDGSAVSRTTYADLFAIIGTSFGAGDGSTTFNLPTKAGLVSLGIKSSDTDFNTIGKTGGSKTDDLSNAYAKVGPASLTESNSTNGYNANSSQQFTSNYLTNGGSSGGGSAYAGTFYATNLGGSVSRLQPYTITNYIIKVKETTPYAGHTVNTHSDSTVNAYSCDYENNCNTYSTSETFTGKYWIDGKPIYRKVFNVGTSNTNEQVQHNISNIDTICNFTCYLKGSDGTTLPTPWFNNFQSQNYFKATMNKTVVDKSANNTWGFTVQCIAEYTKTTD